MSDRARTELVVAVGGPSGAGKTLVAAALRDAWRDDAVVIREDSYCRDHSSEPWPQRADVNVDHPDAIEHRLLAEHLRSLRDGRGVEVPTYDYATFTRRPETERIEPRAIIVLEGILVLAAAALHELIDVRVYVDAPLDLCLHRRLLRDQTSRGLSVAHTLRQYTRTIRPMYERFIAPCRARADFVVANEFARAAITEAIAPAGREIQARLASARATAAPDVAQWEVGQ